MIYLYLMRQFQNMDLTVLLSKIPYQRTNRIIPYYTIHTHAYIQVFHYIFILFCSKIKQVSTEFTYPVLPFQGRASVYIIT